jgi:hypothetical protein
MKTIRKSLAFIFVEILLSGNSLPLSGGSIRGSAIRSVHALRTRISGCGKTEKIPSDDSSVISLYFNACRG